MRTYAILAAVLAALAAGSAVGAGTTSATRLVLQRSDVPAKAKRVSFGTSRGAIKIPQTVRGQAAYSAYRFKNGKATELVASAAGIVKNVRVAHKVFLKLKGNVSGSTFKRLRLPRYGSEQAAYGISVKQASLGVLLVRSGSRLWEVAVSAIPGIGPSRTLGELKKYAAKERARAAG